MLHHAGASSALRAQERSRFLETAWPRVRTRPSHVWGLSAPALLADTATTERAAHHPRRALPGKRIDDYDHRRARRT